MKSAKLQTLWSSFKRVLEFIYHYTHRPRLVTCALSENAIKIKMKFTYDICTNLVCLKRSGYVCVKYTASQSWHWILDKMADILQMIFSIAFSCMTNVVFRLIFDWTLFAKFQFQYARIGSDNGLAPNRRQAIIWINDGLNYWRIYA